ncbi:lymphocyte function-associated antigen 3 isoform X2 [Rhinoderma darwinii]|uniref:lymphocyte function-associated antigen 3 isoform X2 n=1 Tax=Rhinoderma darwinii TaxID=43563 RepID=UPI003F66D49E
MRMMASGVALLLLLGVFSMCRGEEQFKILTGSNVTFKVPTNVSYSEINWLKNSNKIVDLLQGLPPHFYTLKNRVIASFNDGTFTLMNVSPDDGGQYRADVVVGGFVLDRYFSLQVYDHVCKVLVHNTTMEKNVTLTCTCASQSASPSKYEWFNKSHHLVSERQILRVSQQGDPQTFLCSASNEVSQSNASYTVPAARRPENNRTHIVIIISLLLIAAIIAGVFYRCRKRISQIFQPKPGAPDSEVEKKNLKAGGSPFRCCCCVIFYLDKIFTLIAIWKNKEILMIISLHKKSLHLEKLVVQRDGLTIMDVEVGDFGTYSAEVHRRGGGSEIIHFSVLESAQTGEEQEERDSGVVLVYPVKNELRLNIPNAENAERIIWRKDGGDLLTVTCGSDPVAEGLSLYKGSLRMELMSGHDGIYHADVRQSDESSVRSEFGLRVLDLGNAETELQIKRSVKTQSTESGDGTTGAALGSTTFYPVNVGQAEKITWKKGKKILVESENRNDQPSITRGRYSLETESGNLTINNVDESDHGKYVFEAPDDRTTRQVFSLVIKPEKYLSDTFPLLEEASLFISELDPARAQ